MILSLAAVKMEKNFVAYVDKNYSRRPHEMYPINDREQPHNSLIGFVRREMEELETALDILEKHKRTREHNDIIDDDMMANQIYEAMLEVGDVSNTLDYLFEALLNAHRRLKK